MGPTLKGPLSPRSHMATFRVQSDQAMIRCIQDDTANHHKFFTKPPLRSWTLFFKNPSVEREYRRTAWRPRTGGSDPHRASVTVQAAAADNASSSAVAPPSGDAAYYQQAYHHQPKVVSPSVFNAYFDLGLSCLFLFIVTLACFLHYPVTWPWILYFVLAIGYHAAVIAVFVVQMTRPIRGAFRRRSRLSKTYSWARGWIQSHCFGLLLCALPMVAIFANYSCTEITQGPQERDFFMQLVYVGLIHYCNMSALNYFVKSTIATVCALVVVLLLSPFVCDTLYQEDSSQPLTGFQQAGNTTLGYVTTGSVSVAAFQGSSIQGGGGLSGGPLFTETVLCITMLLFLVWMLNREFEVAYRISFHCSLLSTQDRRKIQNLKNQADWLLHNIIPRHISVKLKQSAGYSENHREVGIIFASLVNFNELYDESYMGGKEYLRVLNELISDFDEILDRPEFPNVEKIKTIGSTFMAASGMNPNIRSENTHKYQHIHELMEFVFELQHSVREFNRSLIEFDLVLRIGFNFGDVTSGVIGTTKLYYDIWGDAVNIASRMESTGVDGKIQVNEKCMHVLSEWYTFELRGSIFVKGKDNMTTYILVGNKPGANVSAVCN